CRNGGVEFRVEVEDSGCVIDDEVLPRIFHAFEQAGRSQLGGLGLGLAISKALVEAHRGSINAESQGRDRGAKFSAMFPTCQTNALRQSTDAPTSITLRKSARLLLVEDHKYA